MKEEAWYIARRGTLLAEEFLLELKPKHISSLEDSDVGFDYLAFFLKKDHTPFVIGVEVKATEQEVRGQYKINAGLAKRTFNSNLPTLLVVADVKRNEIYFNWLNKNVAEEQDVRDKKYVIMPMRYSIPSEVEKLRHEILDN